MKPQGRDYTKPRSFTSSPTQNRGAVRVRPGRELYRAPSQPGAMIKTSDLGAYIQNAVIMYL